MRLAIAVTLALALTAAAQARQDSPRQEVATLASQLMSPFCPGRLLVDCTSSQAYELRDTIAARVGTATRAGGRQPAHAVAGDARLLAQVDEALRDLD